MKVGTVLVAVLVAVAALAGTVWIGRSGNLATSNKTSPTAETPAANADDKFTPPEITATGPYPRAVVDEAEYDFGVMSVGEEQKHKFVIRNEGDAPLVVKQGQTTCKCTLSDVAKDEIPPGESVEVELTWHPPGATDSFRQTAEILTNDPEAKVLALVVTGQVAETVILSPPGIWNLGEVVEGKPVDLQGAVHSAVLDEFEILEIESSGSLVKAEAVPMTAEELETHKAKSGYTIKVRLEPDLPVGAIREKLTIKTDIKDGTNLSLQVSGVRAGPIRFIPSPGVDWNANAMAINLGEFAGSEGKKGSLSMFVTGLPEGEDLKFLEVDSDSEFVTLHLEPDSNFTAPDRKRYVLTFEVVPGTPRMTKVLKEAAKITVKTNHSEAGTMKFYVQFVTL